MTPEEIKRWTERLAWLNGLLKEGKFDGADDYYWTKSEYRKALSKVMGVSQTRLDPVGFWHGVQSN